MTALRDSDEDNDVGDSHDFGDDDDDEEELARQPRVIGTGSM